MNHYLSSLATVIVNDLLKNKMDNPTEATLLFVNKTLIIVLGAAGIGFSYLGSGSDEYSLHFIGPRDRFPQTSETSTSINNTIMNNLYQHYFYREA